MINVINVPCFDVVAVKCLLQTPQYQIILLLV